MRQNRTDSWEDVLSVDFSAESEKRNEIKQALLRQVCERSTVWRGIIKEDMIMNQTQKRRIKRSTAVAIVACLTLAVSVTAFAVADYLNLGQHAHYIQGKPELEEPIKMEELGEHVYYETQSEDSNIDQVSTLFDTYEEAKTYLAFDARLFGYVPPDYALEGYRIFNDSNGRPTQNTKYLSLYYYKNSDPDKHIYVQARLMDEETAFSSSAPDEIEEITINGYSAIMMNGSVDILIGDVIYGITAHDLPQDEIIKMAESLTK